MPLAKRIGLIVAICLASIGCDQATKSLAVEYLPRGATYSFLNDFLRVGYTENTGAFLGMGSNLAPELRFWIFVVAVGALLLGLAVYILVHARQAIWPLVGLSLLFAGGFSNFIDRVANNGAVVDFLNIGIGPVRTGIFNVADMAIMAGIALLLLAQSRWKQPDEHNKARA